MPYQMSAGFGEPQGTRCSLEQWYAELAFECPDLMRECGRRQMKGLGRGGEGPPRRDLSQDSETVVLRVSM